MTPRTNLSACHLEVVALVQGALYATVDWIEEPLHFDPEWYYNQLRAVEECIYTCQRILKEIPLDALDKEYVSCGDRDDLVVEASAEGEAVLSRPNGSPTSQVTPSSEFP